MFNHKFSKETIWAVCIIILCVLAACFLFLKTAAYETDTLSPLGKTIILPEIKTQTSISYSASSEDPLSSETLELFPENENTTSASGEIPLESAKKAIEISYNCPIDFESLWEINEDVYAWITIPGTRIDYPILQHETDNSYYLNYNIDGTEGYPGCIYTENINAKDFTDNNTVIYGHNMRNGTMFTDLHKFRDSEFFAANDMVYIYTPEKQLTYKIFAAYLYDDRHLMNSFDFSDNEVYSDYLDEILSMDSEDVNLRKDDSITVSDKILTLITCIREQPEKRVYVQAVLQPYHNPN